MTDMKEECVVLSRQEISELFRAIDVFLSPGYSKALYIDMLIVGNSTGYNNVRLLGGEVFACDLSSGVSVIVLPNKNPSHNRKQDMSILAIITSSKTIKMPECCGYLFVRDDYEDFVTSTGGIAVSLRFENVDFSEVKDTSYMMYGMEELIDIDFGNAQFSRIKHMNEMFGLCPALRHIKFGSFKGARDIDISCCFNKYPVHLKKQGGKNLLRWKYEHSGMYPNIWSPRFFEDMGTLTIDFGDLRPSQIKDVDKPIIIPDLNGMFRYGAFDGPYDFSNIDYVLSWDVVAEGKDALVVYINERDSRYKVFKDPGKIPSDWMLDNAYSALEAEARYWATGDLIRNCNFKLMDIDAELKEILNDVGESWHSIINSPIAGRSDRLGIVGRYSEVEGRTNIDDLLTEISEGAYAGLGILHGGTIDPIPPVLSAPLSFELQFRFDINRHLTDYESWDDLEELSRDAKKDLKDNVVSKIKRGVKGRRQIVVYNSMPDVFKSDKDDEHTLYNFIVRLVEWLKDLKKLPENNSSVKQIIEIADKLHFDWERNMRLVRRYMSIVDQFFVKEYGISIPSKRLEDKAAKRSKGVSKGVKCGACFGIVKNGKCTACGRTWQTSNIQEAPR